MKKESLKKRQEISSNSEHERMCRFCGIESLIMINEHFWQFFIQGSQKLKL